MTSEALVPLDPAWPAMTLAQTDALLTAPGARFEMETVDIAGVATRTWKNAPPTLRFLAQAIRAHGGRVFTVYQDERVTYEANWRATAQLANQLWSMGVRKGDRVAIAMRNLPEWPVAFFAAASIGAIAVPLNAWWVGEELAYGLSDSGAKVAILDGQRHDRLTPHYDALPDLEHVIVSRADASLEGPKFHRLEVLIGTPNDWAGLDDVALPDVEIAPDDAATIFYTSGTTGQAKGALGTHRNICSNILSAGYVQARGMLRRGETPGEPAPKVSLLVIPLFHVTACSAALMPGVVTGSTVIFMRRWDPLEAMAIIEREKVQFTGGVPTIAWQLLEHPERDKYDLSSLDTISYGGAPSAPELVKRIYKEFGALPGNGWGMTETMATVTQHSGEDYLNRPTSCGPPVPVAELKIVSQETGETLPTGDVGELWARGPMVVKGYWNKPEASAETFVDGWVKTGDLARLDEEGFCYIVDRAKDIIIRGGENIYSSEVEDVLYAHPAVIDAALVGIPHHQLGEQPGAVVHLAPGASASEDELRAWVGRHLAAFKVPVAVKFTDAVLPRNANGKILKTELRGLFAAEEA
ncbi:class I adenylate-forming enzyme family protein [Stakelama tenebrarum]|uniref:3-methylmercaptopropionyl-CoA ligase n=1 Tax=Stakelama tenebrarum TaxID=2711215 RepID=A0A6G6Y751_9SPHN|nr:class I adenylate-forming enzyme family protein [Sphingosinithalassobacter tenebrarum]QIG80538.1 acyl--CoA ligase [Sphingosinithalassobacter tenebrarum]